MTERIRILVADDSPTLRAALTALLEADPRLSVVGEARDGVEAVRQAVDLHPDVVTMDVLMPRQDGLGAIQEIMDRAPTRILVVSSVADDLQLNLSFRSISLGALEVISKPCTERPEDLRAWGRRVADAVSLMAEVPVVRRRRGVSTSPLPSARRARGPAVLEHDAKVSAFGIVASTGGPPALAKLLAKLPQDLPIPVLVAQHMAPGFGRGLAHWLYQVSGPRVIVALHGAPVLPGAVYLPPDGMDLEVGPHQDLRVTPASGRHVPSGDRLLDSLARVYGSRAGGAVLTGMGDDGALGLLEIRRRGGVTMAQEEEDSKLILDPDLDTYYTMDGLLLRGPELVDRVTALGDQTAAMLAKGSVTSEERSALSEASALLQFHLDGLEVDVKTAIQEAPGLSNHEGLGPALTPSMGRVGAEVRSLLDVTIELAKTGKSSASPAEVVEATDRALSTVGSHWQTLLDQEDTMLSIRMHGDLRRRAFALWSVLVAVLGTFGLTFLVLRSITVPIQRAADVAKQLARGELPESVEVSKATDEPGELLRAVNDMLRFLDLRRTMRSLQESGQMLAAAVAQLEAQTTEQAEAATRQAAALQETQVTSQEIRQTSKVAAEKAQGVLQAAEKADAVSRSGETAIERSIGGLADIRGQVEQTVDKIAELEKRTQQIGFITQTVKDLADQSNMLALNAAIEAVRSGEHGKGFAVVAREIRNLADQSIQATNRVTEILDSVLLSIREAVAMTGSGRERVEAGSVEIKSSGESLRELSRVVRDSSHSVRQIAAAVGQQDAGINQIFIALGDQSTLMDQTVRRLDDSRRAVSTVRDVVGRVTEIVGRFQT